MESTNNKKVEQDLRHVEVHARRLQNKEKGYDFISLKAVQKDGRFIDMRIVKDAKNHIRTEGKYTCVIDASLMNIDRNRKYPILWVKEVEEILPYEQTSQPISEDDLPF